MSKTSQRVKKTQPVTKIELLFVFVVATLVGLIIYYTTVHNSGINQQWLDGNNGLSEFGQEQIQQVINSQDKDALNELFDANPKLVSLAASAQVSGSLGRVFRASIARPWTKRSPRFHSLGSHDFEPNRDGATQRHDSSRLWIGRAVSFGHGDPLR